MIDPVEDAVRGHLRLAFDPRSAGVARRQVATCMRAHGVVDESCEDAALVVTELVSNALRHASPVADGVLTLRWRLDCEGLVLSLTDGGSSVLPRPRQADPSAQNGRGLAIVETLAASWWTELDRDASTVHALLCVN